MKKDSVANELIGFLFSSSFCTYLCVYRTVVSGHGRASSGGVLWQETCLSRIWVCVHCASCTQCRGAGRRSCLVLCLVYLTATGRSATLCALGLYSRVTTVENDAYPRIICPCRRHRMYFTSPLWIPPAGTGKGVTSSGQPSLNLAVVQPSRS